MAAKTAKAFTAQGPQNYRRTVRNQPSLSDLLKEVNLNV
jgi:hypothetical protein